MLGWSSWQRETWFPSKLGDAPGCILNDTGQTLALNNSKHFKSLVTHLAPLSQRESHANCRQCGCLQVSFVHRLDEVGFGCVHGSSLVLCPSGPFHLPMFPRISGGPEVVGSRAMSSFCRGSLCAQPRVQPLGSWSRSPSSALLPIFWRRVPLLK